MGWTPISHEFRRALYRTILEYLAVVLPIGIYLIIESLHAGNVSPLTSSPEWNIGTVFLVVQGQLLYRENLEESGRRVSSTKSGIASLLALVVIVLAIANAQMGLEADSNALVVCRWLLLVFSSGLFFVYVSGSRLLTAQRGAKWEPR